MPGRARVPNLVRRCVRSVSAEKGYPVDQAFAICVGSLQNKGYVKKGKMELTKKGDKRSRSRAQDPEQKQKIREYERLLAANRGKSESEYEVFRDRAPDCSYDAGRKEQRTMNSSVSSTRNALQTLLRQRSSAHNQPVFESYEALSGHRKPVDLLISRITSAVRAGNLSAAASFRPRLAELLREWRDPRLVELNRRLTSLIGSAGELVDIFETIE